MLSQQIQNFPLKSTSQGGVGNAIVPATLRDRTGTYILYQS